jgi:hypothetical protein
MEIRWENGLGGSGRYERILGLKCTDFKQKKSKKSVRICPIRPIRSPIVSPFSKAEIAVMDNYFVQILDNQVFVQNNHSSLLTLCP